MQIKSFLNIGLLCLGLSVALGIREWTMFRPHTDKLEGFLLKVQLPE